MSDWDWYSDKLLSEFVKWAKEKHGKVSLSMSSFKAVEGNISRAQFRRALRHELTFKSEDFSYLFAGLSLTIPGEGKHGGDGSITKNILLSLDQWDPDKEHED